MWFLVTITVTFAAGAPPFHRLDSIKVETGFNSEKECEARGEQLKDTTLGYEFFYGCAQGG